VEEFVKRIRLLVVAGVIAAALPIGISAAGATGSPPPPNSVTIRERAQYNFNGTYIEVGLTVKCKSTSNPLRTVEVFVKQDYPETPFPQGATGLGARNVVCDGVSRSVAVTVPVGLFDAGRAWAEARLDPFRSPPTASHKRWITIVHV
jgi:hypothetical protein